MSFHCLFLSIFAAAAAAAGAAEALLRWLSDIAAIDAMLDITPCLFIADAEPRVYYAS